MQTHRCPWRPPPLHHLWEGLCLEGMAPPPLRAVSGAWPWSVSFGSAFSDQIKWIEWTPPVCNVLDLYILSSWYCKNLSSVLLIFPFFFPSTKPNDMRREAGIIVRGVLTRTAAVSLSKNVVHKLHHEGFMLHFRFMRSVWVANFKVLLPLFWRCRWWNKTVQTKDVDFKLLYAYLWM